jgi:hypothetical protein
VNHLLSLFTVFLEIALAFIGPIPSQPFGQVPCRAVCGAASLAGSAGHRLAQRHGALR